MRREAINSRVVWALGILLALPGLLTAQDNDQDQYRIEYAVYEKARGIADPADKGKALTGFIGQFPKSTLIPYVEGEYRNLLTALYQGGKHDQTLALSNDWLKIRPDDAAALFYTANIHYAKKQYPQAIRQAEKLHGSADADTKKTLSYIITFSALRSGDSARLVQYGDETCKLFPLKDCYPVIVELMKHHMAKDLSKSSSYADRALEGLATVQATDEATKKYVNDNRILAYAVKGNNAFEREKWSSTISNFQKVLRSTRNKTLIGECYYKIGMSYWRLGKIQPEAMQSFARGYKRGADPYSNQCRKYLEDLYKASHNGSLAGMDEFIENATED